MTALGWTHHLWLVITVGWLVVVPTATSAAEQRSDSALLQVHSQHALNALFGLPVVAARPIQGAEWQLAVEHANQFIGSRSTNEQLMLDGETTEVTLRHRRQLSRCWQGEVTLPFIQHSAGYFDQPIDDWHQFFNLPDAGRDETEFDVLNYSYSRENGDVVSVKTPQSGLGDIQLSVQRTLSCQSSAGLAGSEAIVRTGIKLPTGEAAELRGSGKVDAYLDIQSPIWSHGKRLTSGATLGVMRAGNVGSSWPSQRSVVVFGALGVQLKVHSNYRLLAQLDWHTPFYRSALSPLRDVSVLLTTGLRYLASNHHTVELTISEDIAVETAPDIAIRLAWVYRPSTER